jgi:hypothetical protein
MTRPLSVLEERGPFPIKTIRFQTASGDLFEWTAEWRLASDSGPVDVGPDGILDLEPGDFDVERPAAIFQDQEPVRFAHGSGLKLEVMAPEPGTFGTMTMTESGDYDDNA